MNLDWNIFDALFKIDHDHKLSNTFLLYKSPGYWEFYIIQKWIPENENVQLLTTARKNWLSNTKTNIQIKHNKKLPITSL